MMNEECIVRKLVADGDGAGDDKRFALLVTLLIKSMKDPEIARSNLPRIMQILDAAETSMHKQVLIATMNEHQSNQYRQMAQEIDKEIVRAHERMQAAKKELEAAKAIRRNKEEYEALANVIQQFPSRHDTNLKLEAVKKELEEQHERQRKLEAKEGGVFFMVLKERESLFEAEAFFGMALDDTHVVEASVMSRHKIEALASEEEESEAASRAGSMGNGDVEMIDES
ncbi:THO complex subunit 7 -like protein [Toxocara canis]|uniref:THO complex subunit 7-like protein n=1 Tax=Toxocara canis TaxID=6265 RepID=A0A0B2W2B6_TOXCA|nr:THO complex subunit 7 -like protein [Toxocara canis]